MRVLYENGDHRVVEEQDAEHGIHIQVKQGESWGVGMWDGKAIVKSLIYEVRGLKIALETEKTKRFI